MKKWTERSTWQLVISAMMVALSIILTRVFSWQPAPYVRIGFGAVPILFAGAVCGPVAGFMVGLVADLVGFLINPMGGTIFIGITLCSALTGVFTGVFCKYVFKQRHFVSVLIGVTVTELLVSVVIKSFFFVHYYGSTFWVYAAPKLIYTPAIIAAETFLVWLIINALKKSRISI